MVKLINNLWDRINDEKMMIAFSLAVVLIVNIQLLSSFFFVDDFLLFYQIANWHPLEFIFSNFGSHLFIFRNFVFYCMYKLFGTNSIPYFSIVLFTHLGCAYILYKTIHLLTENPAIAAAGMMIWGICPVNYATMAWFSTYGMILVGFFFLLFLYDLLRMEKGKIVFSRNIMLRWSVYLFLMAASYGPGLAIACFSPIAIVIILWENDKKWKIAASMLPVIAVIMLLFIFRDSIFYYLSGEVQDTKAWTLSFALSNYKLIMEMIIRMCAYSIYCMASFPLLFISSTIKYPIAAFFISVPVLILFIVLFFRSPEYRRRHYTFLFILFFGLIGLIAYGRAPFSALINCPISAASVQPRYFYVILIIVVITLSLMANNLLDIFPNTSKVVVLFIFILLALSIYPSIDLAKRIDIANISVSSKEIFYKTIADIEKTIMAQPEGSSVFIDNVMNPPIPFYLPAITDFPGKAAVFCIKYPDNTVKGRRVYFVEKDCRLAQKNIEKKNWRISSLLVSACDISK